MRRLILISVIILGLNTTIFADAITGESLPSIKSGQAAQNVGGLWNDYDPCVEPLETEVLEQWEDSGVCCSVIRYCVGTFHGKKAMMAALYAYPKGGKSLAGLVQIHGGGQHANLNAVMTNALRGYACISINWLGNQMAGLRDGKPWQWEGLNTDWGYVDATQNTHNSHFVSLSPDEKTIDDIESPRNSNWFLGVMAARRAVTFLQRQPQVDGSKIGMYGHSMGAKLTFDTSAIDKRIKAACASAGAQANQKEGLYGATVATYAYYPQQSCPVMFLNPSNDFHGTIDNIEETIDGMASKQYRLSRVPHLNHRTQPEYTVSGLLWFDEHLKGTFQFPKTPELSVNLNTLDGVPAVIVTPDTSKQILEVDVYFSRGSCIATDRYWELADTENRGAVWVARCPIISTDQPLRVYANVRYPLTEQVTGASFYYQIYTASNFWISSRMLSFDPDAIRAAGVKATDSRANIIEDFGQNWKKKWYLFNYDGQWPYRSHKLKDAKWQAPCQDAQIAIDIKSLKPDYISLQLDEYTAVKKVHGTGTWETIVFNKDDFKLVQSQNSSENNNLPTTIKIWKDFAEIVLGPAQVDDADPLKVEFAQGWQDQSLHLRDLRWIPVENMGRLAPNLQDQ